VWELRAFRTEGGTTDQIRPWISGFVAAMGEDRASLLLKDAGVLAILNVTNDEDSKWDVEIGQLMDDLPKKDRDFLQRLHTRFNVSKSVVSSVK
jgi:hypothetical protein